MERRLAADATRNRVGRMSLGGRILLASLGLALAAGPSLAGGDSDSDSDHDDRRRGRRGPQHCSQTAKLQFQACRFEVKDDYFGARAICTNESDRRDRRECFADASRERRQGERLCRAQKRGRRDLCDLLGEERYDPDFDEELFDDDFTDLTRPNPYFPLAIGNQWTYESEDESNTVTVTDRTKNVDDVTCIVVRDFVVAEDASEDTDDWFGQRKDGTVDYCGEEVKDFEFFEGDEPMLPELVATDGSFKAGRDGDRSGTLMLGDPQVGDTYRQEFSAGNAEDAATVLSIDYGIGSHPELDDFVPQDLVELMCADHDCLVTSEFTPIEPGVLERKYYARGVGVFLEVKPEDGEVNRIVACNVHPKCDGL